MSTPVAYDLIHLMELWGSEGRDGERQSGGLGSLSLSGVSCDIDEGHSCAPLPHPCVCKATILNVPASWSELGPRFLGQRT